MRQTISLEKILLDFESFLTKKNYFLYDIINKTQIQNITKTEHFNNLNELCREMFYASNYENKEFIVQNKNEYQLIKIYFAWIFNDYLEEVNIDISNEELVNNNDVNIDYLTLFEEWLNIDKEEIRNLFYDKKYFILKE